MTKVLLLEDHQSFRHQFEHVFGDGVDHCFTHREMVDHGDGWDYAFIDFELNDKFTGLGALMYLRDYSPHTKVIIFTAIGERGRTLFALAGREWFNAWAILDKGRADDDILQGIAAGVDPTTPQWKGLLASSWMINNLFQKPSWLQIWRMWAIYGGSQRAISSASNGDLTLAAVRDFGEDALAAADMVQRQFFPTDTRPGAAPGEAGNRRYKQRAVPISDFYHSHSNFFDAPELAEVLEAAQPWQRRT